MVHAVWGFCTCERMSVPVSAGLVPLCGNATSFPVAY